MSKSFLEEALGGIYTPGMRFAFTNISDEDFVSYWAKVPILVKAGETIELSDATPLPGTGMGQTLAVKMTGELVDKIMLREVKLKEVEYYKANPGAQVNSYRGPNSLGVPNARKPYEDQILKPLAVDEDSPAMQAARQQILQDIQEGMDGKDEGVGLPKNEEEFAQIAKLKEQDKKVEKKAAKTKKLA